MQPCMVAHVDEICLTRPHPMGYGYGIGNRLMRAMGLGSEAVDDERVYPLQCLQSSLGSCQHIGDKAQPTDTVAQYGELAVHNLQRHHLDTAYGDWRQGLYSVKVEPRHTGIEHLTEEIGQALAKMGAGEVIGKDVDIAKPAEWAQVVNSARMVVVLMGEQHTVDMVEWNAQHLLTEVGTAINQDTRIAHLHECRHTQPVVAWVIRGTHRAGASYLGHTGRGTRTKKRHLHD